MKTCLHWLTGGSLLVLGAALAGVGCGDGAGSGGQGNPALNFVGTGSTGQSSSSFAEPPRGGKTSSGTTQDFVKDNPTGGEGDSSGRGGSGLDSSQNLSSLSPTEAQQLCAYFATTLAGVQCEGFESMVEPVSANECAGGIALLGACGITVGDLERCFGGVAASCDASGCPRIAECFDDDVAVGGFDGGVDDNPPVLDGGIATPGLEANCAGYCAITLECVGQSPPDCETTCNQLVSSCGQPAADYINSCAAVGCDAFFECASTPPSCPTAS